MRFLLAAAFCCLSLCHALAQGVPTRMSDAEMWRFLVGGVDGNHRWLKPVDPGFNFTDYLHENDPIFWFRTDAGVDPQGNDYADTQRMDSQMLLRGGQWIGMRAFDYGDPANSGAGFFNFDPASDGGDLYQVRDVLLADGSTARGAVDFYTRDGGSQNGLWFLAQDCKTPGWVHFLNDVDAIQRKIQIRGPAIPQAGGLSPPNPANCDGDSGGVETTWYKEAFLQIPYWVDNTLQPPRLFDTIISMHWNMAPDSVLGPSEMFVFVRDLGLGIWRRYDTPGIQSWQANANLLAQWRIPFVGGLSDPHGVVIGDNRHGMRLWTVPDGKRKGKDFAWPPSTLVPPP